MEEISQQILDLQKSAYAERIGKIYGDLEVIDVKYDWEKRKQLWTMRCINCGEERQTYDGYEYAKGKNSGKCRCRGRARRELEKIEKNKKSRDLPSDPQWMGQVFGEWKVLGYQSGRGWKVQCVDCGREAYHSVNKIKALTAPKCLCKFNYGKYNSPDWIGQKYGRLTILKYESRNFLCQCDCGAEKRVKPTHLLQGLVTTCGKCGFHGEKSRTHGMSQTRLYRIWKGMNERCYNPKCKAYLYYGGRGINICEKWKNNLFSFIQWAEQNGYSDELSIDRINCDGNYEPANCRWATLIEQANNQHPKYTFKTRPNKIIHKRKIAWTIDGVTKSAQEWCEQYKISVPTAMYRIIKKHMPIKDALSIQQLPGGRNRK